MTLRNTRSLTLTIAGAAALALLLLASRATAGGDAKKGASVFQTTCVPCHGATGKGDGPAAAALNPRPRDLTDKAIMSTLSDQRVFDTIRKGGQAVGKSPLMPAQPGLTDAQIWDLVAHIRALCKCSGK